MWSGRTVRPRAEQSCGGPAGRSDAWNQPLGRQHSTGDGDFRPWRPDRAIRPRLSFVRPSSSSFSIRVGESHDRFAISPMEPHPRVRSGLRKPCHPPCTARLSLRTPGARTPSSSRAGPRAPAPVWRAWRSSRPHQLRRIVDADWPRRTPSLSWSAYTVPTPSAPVPSAAAAMASSSPPRLP
jgi:hypothetical protein